MNPRSPQEDLESPPERRPRHPQTRCSKCGVAAYVIIGTRCPGMEWTCLACIDALELGWTVSTTDLSKILEIEAPEDLSLRVGS